MSRQVGADNVIIVLASVGQCGHAWPGGDAVVVVDTGHVYPAVPSCTQCAAHISRLYPDTALSISRACMKVCHQDNAVCSDDLWLIFYCFSGNYIYSFSFLCHSQASLAFAIWILDPKDTRTRRVHGANLGRNLSQFHLQRGFCVSVMF